MSALQISQAPVVLVTGAGGNGIGLATCLTFARAGYAVVATDISPLDNTVSLVQQEKAECLPLHMDVCDKESVEQAVQSTISKYGRIDVLVNNAARSLGSGVLEMSEETWLASVNLVLNSVFRVTRAVLPHMLQSERGGSIVNVASVNGQTGIGEEAYSAAKAGVINFTQNLAVRYGPQKIRCNCVSPGTIETVLWKERLEREPRTLENLKKYYPLGRIGQGQDVANAIFFLASEKASWITGTTLNVDGGLMAGSSQLQKDLMGE